MGYGQRVLRAIAVGLPGVVLIPFVLTPPAGIPAALLAVNPLILLIIAALIGAWAAPKAGLRSFLLTGSEMDQSALTRTAIAGVVVGAVIALLDHWARGVWRSAGLDAPVSLIEGTSWSGLALGVTYGGMTEEILLRFGLMSLLLVVFAKLMPHHTAGFMAIALSAALFAVGHLPALIASGIELETPLLIRTMGLNGLLGGWFGWLYFSRDLECAIKAHAGFHVGAFLMGMLAF